MNLVDEIDTATSAAETHTQWEESHCEENMSSSESWHVEICRSEGGCCNDGAFRDEDLGSRSKTEDPWTNVLVNLNGCCYPVFAEACKILGWKVTEHEDKWTLRWVDRYCLGQTLRDMRLKRPQRINHFPGMFEIAHKCRMAANLNKVRAKLPADFDFYPQTWVLPEELGALERAINENPSRPFIVKPNGGSQGQGIFFTRRFADVPKEGKYVAQRYLNKPLLIDKFKFDLRIYVLITSVYPLRVYVAREGLARFCTEEYSSISKQNCENQFKHLTNYAINKNNTAFQNPTAQNIEVDTECHPSEHMDGEMDEVDCAGGKNHQIVGESGSKRSLSSVFRWLDANGFESEKVRHNIQVVIVKTILSVLPANQNAYKMSFPESRDSVGASCFTVLGFDILLDSTANAWLIETNELPSFETGSQLDYDVKMSVVKEALEMVCPRGEEERLLKELSDSFSPKIDSCAKGKKDEKDEEWRRITRQRILDLRVQHERSYCRTFVSVYPSNEPEASQIYNRCLEASWEVFRGMFGGGVKPQPAGKSWEQCLRGGDGHLRLAGDVGADVKSPTKKSEDEKLAVVNQAPRVYTSWKERLDDVTSGSTRGRSPAFLRSDERRVYQEVDFASRQDVGRRCLETVLLASEGVCV